MEDIIFLGRDQQIYSVSQAMWKQHLAQIPEHEPTRMEFMTDAHHLVRNFVVKEIAIRQQPIEPMHICAALKLPPDQVKNILDELEEKLFFLVRNEQGAVIWAYPITIETTSHRLSFNNGDRLYAAGAEDAIAAPFVQGKLQKKYISVEIETKCKHCDQSLHILIDSNMKVFVREQEVTPLVFMPDVDWSMFTQRTIIDAYGRNSVFFWSEEHARDYRTNVKQVIGIYLTLEQCAYMTPITQGTLFSFTGASLDRNSGKYRPRWLSIECFGMVGMREHNKLRVRSLFSFF